MTLRPDRTSFDPSRRDVARLLGGGAVLTILGGAQGRAETVATTAPVTRDAMQGAGFYRMNLGGTTVAVVSDGGFPMDPAALFPDVPADAMSMARREAFLPAASPYPGHLNALLVREGPNTILVDTGGAAMAPTTGRLHAHLARMNVAPRDVTHVLITHAHPDHIGGLLTADGRPAFPNARVLVSEAEHRFWTGDDVRAANSALPAEAMRGMAEAARKSFAAVKDRLEMLRIDQTVGGAITVLDAAGHTPGHVALRVDAGGEKLLYVTDAVHLRPLQFAHPEWQILFDADRDQAMRSRRLLLDMAANERLRVSGAHLAFPAVGYVEKGGEGYRWVPDVWEW